MTEPVAKAARASCGVVLWLNVSPETSVAALGVVSVAIGSCA